MNRIVILDGHTLNPGDNPWDPLEEFGAVVVHDRTPRELLGERAAGAAILVTNKAPIPCEAIELLPDLKLIAVTATGYDIVDVAAARALGVTVVNVPRYGTTAVAQFTWALILELCHHVGRHAESVANGDWSRCPDFSYWLTPQVELADKRLGVVGYGHIGRRVAAIARAFGMSVLAHDGDTATPRDHDDTRWLSIEELFSEADVVTLHCPLTPATERMVDRSLLRRMRPGAFLVNAARGGLIDEPALVEALNEGTIAAAAVDVVSVEPMPADHPLALAPNCIITPHMAWSALEARKRIMQTTADNIRAFLEGRPQNVVT